MRKLLPIILLAFCANSFAQFTPGNLVIYRVGTGSGSLVNTGNAVFMDEYTPAGTLVRSVAIPATDPDGAGPNFPLIASGTATSEGLLNRSADGRYLVVTGYGTTTGGASVSGTTSASVPRVVGLVDYQGNVNTSTALSDFASGNNPRSATSLDGTAVWVAGAAGGIRYATTGTTASGSVSTTITNLRTVNIFQNQLYVSASSGAIRIATVGSGLPTASGQTMTNLPGYPTTGNSAYQIMLFDLDAGVAGPDVLYVSDDGIGLQKYSLVGGTWVLNGTVGTASDTYRGLTGTVSGTTVTLYATRKGGSGATGGGELVSLVDASGYNGAFSGTPTLLATAAANTAFRGIAFAPVQGSVSTPNNLSLTFNTAANTAINPPAVSGTIGDATDPGLIPGITVDVKDNGVVIPAAAYTLTASSNNTTAVPNNNVSISTFDGLATIRINPAAAGYSDITLTLTSGGNTKTLIINYAASAAPVVAAGTTAYWHTGIADASAAIALDDDYMVIGNDETNFLYVYNRKQPGLPVKTFDFNQGNLLNLTDGNTGAWKELDLEAGARSIANPATVYWLGSMSNSSNFNDKPNRNRLIAVTMSGTGAATSFVNAGYVSLRSNLIAWGDANGYNFTASAAAGVDPKTINGFNAEGMAFGPDNTTLFIGFRAPLVPLAGRVNAVIAPIQNFEAWFNGTPAVTAPVIGAPIELNLGGRGIRDIIRLSNGNYVILAGSYDETSNPAVYRWSGKASDAPVAISSFNVAGLNPEGVMQVNESGVLSLNKLQIINDDGDNIYYADATEAKDLTQDNFKKFSSDIIVSSDASALPVQFETFTAIRQGNAVALNWKTGVPGSIDVFDVQRSVNGLDFTTIGSVSAMSARTAYSFTDNQPGTSAKIYYRINAREITGASNLSTVRVITSGVTETVKLYPNPAANGVVSLQVTAPGEKQVAIYNSKGQLQAQYAFSEPVKDISTAQWPAGYYLVKVSVAGVPVTTTLLIVQ